MRVEPVNREQEMGNDHYRKPRIWVAGTGVTRFGELWAESVRSLTQQAGREALEEAKIKIDEVDLLIASNFLLSQLEHQAHLGAVVGEAMNFKGPTLAVEAACASGGLAIRQGVMAIKAGLAKRVLVVGVEKMTDTDNTTITRALMSAGSEGEQWAGATFPSLYALMHQQYINKYHVDEQLMAAIPVLAHEHGVLNPLAHFQNRITVEQVLKSAWVADPIRQLHCAPISDGAAAVVLKSTVDSGQRAVEFVGSGQGGDTLSLANRKSLVTLKATREAIKQALDQAKVTLDQIKVVEVHDCFSIAAALAVEDLGLVKPGEGAKQIALGYGSLGNPAFVINPSGGLKACGHPVGATGVKQVVEITRQLQGRCGKRQVEGARVGLTHNVGGTGATVVVHILKVNSEQ
jgi:acetyl-CoA C-acetyltransferase